MCPNRLWIFFAIEFSRKCEKVKNERETDLVPIFKAFPLAIRKKLKTQQKTKTQA